jgi:hypothetical protein
MKEMKQKTAVTPMKMVKEALTKEIALMKEFNERIDKQYLNK